MKIYVITRYDGMEVDTVKAFASKSSADSYLKEVADFEKKKFGEENVTTFESGNILVESSCGFTEYYVEQCLLED